MHDQHQPFHHGRRGKYIKWLLNYVEHEDVKARPLCPIAVFLVIKKGTFFQTLHVDCISNLRQMNIAVQSPSFFLSLHKIDIFKGCIQTFLRVCGCPK